MTLFAALFFLFLLAVGVPVLLLIWLFWLAMGAPRHEHIPRTRNTRSTFSRKD